MLCPGRGEVVERLAERFRRAFLHHRDVRPRDLTVFESLILATRALRAASAGRPAPMRRARRYVSAAHDLMDDLAG